MDWLRNWDDLVHGTLVFAAMLPFVAAGIAALVLPAAWRWFALGLALAGSYLWLFGVPAVPPGSSDDAAIWGLGLASVLVAAFGQVALCGRAVLWWGGWAVLFWLLYPAWLAQDGGTGRKALVAFGLGLAVTAVAGGGGFLLGCRGGGQATGAAVAGGEGVGSRVTLGALVPPLVGLAVLLQLGGAARFGQSAGAVSAALAALLIVGLLRKPAPPPPARGLSAVAAVAGALFALFAACGWLFAEVRWGLGCLLLLAPLSAWAARILPLPRRGRVAEAAWDLLASAVVAGAVAAVAVAEYLEDAAASEGY